MDSHALAGARDEPANASARSTRRARTSCSIRAQLLRREVTAADAADTLYAICDATTYRRLTGGARKASRYAAWLTATLEARLLRDRNAES